MRMGSILAKPWIRAARHHVHADTCNSRLNPIEMIDLALRSSALVWTTSWNICICQVENMQPLPQITWIHVHFAGHMSNLCVTGVQVWLHVFPPHTCFKSRGGQNNGHVDPDMRLMDPAHSIKSGTPKTSGVMRTKSPFFQDSPFPPILAREWRIRTDFRKQLGCHQAFPTHRRTFG